MARVQLTRQATQHFEALPHDLQEPILNTLTDIQAHREEAGKPLLGRLGGLWSARVGRYRIIYSIEGSRRSPTVIVRAIKHRSQVYHHGPRHARRTVSTIRWNHTPPLQRRRRCESLL